MYYPCQEEFYKVWNAIEGQFVFKGSREELISHIAAMFANKSYEISILNKKELWFHIYFGQYSNSFIEKCACSLHEKNRYFYIFDNFDRIINVIDLMEESFNLYQKWRETWIFPNYIHSDYWLKNKKFKKNQHRALLCFKYRREPVPYTRKLRGRKRWRKPRTKHIFLMYDNPEYKEFNRGTKKLVPSCWDDKIRCSQKSWKEQSKARHQWQRGNK